MGRGELRGVLDPRSVSDRRREATLPLAGYALDTFALASKLTF